MENKLLKEKYSEGISLIFANATSLQKKSETYFQNDDYRSALFFSFTALEELGKASLLLNNYHKKSISEGEWYNLSWAF